MSLIDPLRLAQFMMLPGAGELVEAFSAIPPGPVRNSVVSMAQALAEDSGWNPVAGFSQPLTAREIPAQPPKLESPFAQNLHASTVEGRIVERALRGESDHVIAADLGVALGLVVQLKRKARKEGGVVFPGDEKAAEEKAKLQAKRKSLAPGERLNKAGRRIPAPSPPPQPPYWWEDPASPVWDNPKLLPNAVSGHIGSMAAVGPNDGRAYSSMARAAERQGMTLQAYIARRQAMVDRVLAGETPVQVAKSMNVTGYEIYGVLNNVGHARNTMAGSNVKSARETPPEAAPEPAPGAKRISPSYAGTGRHAKMLASLYSRAAKRWGFADVETYMAARERIRDLRMAGYGPLPISQAGYPIMMVKGALDAYRAEGLEYPPVMFGVPVPKEARRAA